MARARNIKPSFFKNEDLAELPFHTRLLFIGLWTLADREGRLEDRPKRIKMEIFPGDNVDVEKGLNELHEAGFILRYAAGNGRYIEVLAFVKHQNPHHREPDSTIPKPEALPPMQPNQSPRLEGDAKPVKPEASTGQARGEAGTSPSPALLIPDSPSLNPESPIKTPAALAASEPIFGEWIDFLQRKGVKADSARTFIGLMRKGYGDELVVEVMQEAERQDITSPKAWISKALQVRSVRRAQGGGASQTTKGLTALENLKVPT